MTQAFKTLKKKYLGEGINHEGQPFKATFETTSPLGIDGISFTYTAQSSSGTLFHTESSLIGKNLSGKLALWVLSSNHPGILERQLISETKLPTGSSYIFAFGNKTDRNSFREEILLEITDEQLRYVYFWGMPGGDFAERSGCTMKVAD